MLKCPREDIASFWYKQLIFESSQPGGSHLNLLNWNHVNLHFKMSFSMTNLAKQKSNSKSTETGIKPSSSCMGEGGERYTLPQTQGSREAAWAASK